MAPSSLEPQATGQVAGPRMGQLDDASSPRAVVERFLDLLCAGDVDRAVKLLSVDVEYANVGAPTVHGRENVRRLFRATLGRAASGFDVYMHAISADGPTVLTERTDLLKVRRLHVQLWVCGRFDVQEGQIVLWRDYVDRVTFVAAGLRGLIGAVVPAVRAKPPRVAPVTRAAWPSSDRLQVARVQPQ